MIPTPTTPGLWEEERWRSIVNKVCERRSLKAAEWKGGGVAVALSFDSDHETLTLRSGDTSRSKLSQGQCGNRTAIPRILAMLARHGIPATFFVPAVRGAGDLQARMIPLCPTHPESFLGNPSRLIRMDAWAMRSTGGGPLPRRTVKPAQHWDWPSPTPYSQGLRCGPWLFVGGQAALDEDGNVVGAGNRAEQTELVIRYVAHVLGAAGACFDDVLKLNTYYCRSVGAGALQGGAEARSRSCSPPGPALSDVPVDELAYPGMLVEIEAIAAIGPRRGVEPR